MVKMYINLRSEIPEEMPNVIYGTYIVCCKIYFYLFLISTYYFRFTIQFRLQIYKSVINSNF